MFFHRDFFEFKGELKKYAVDPIIRIYQLKFFADFWGPEVSRRRHIDCSKKLCDKLILFIGNCSEKVFIHKSPGYQITVH